MKMCPECGNYETITLHEEEICKSCGLVLDEPIHQQYIDEVKRQYAQMPSLATAGSRQINGKIVKTPWLYSTREKNLETSNNALDLIASRQKLTSSVILEAKMLYREAVRQNFNIGRDATTVMYACVYTACIIHKLPKIPRELILNSGVKKTQLLRTYTQLKRTLDIKTESLKSIDIVERYANKLRLEQPIIQEAIKIIEQVEKEMIGKRPETIVASALYIASKRNNKKLSQRKLANTLGIIEVTIRKRSKEIMELTKIDS